MSDVARLALSCKKATQNGYPAIIARKIKDINIS
jgi:hypothetical protein